ncbi:MAG: NAD(P)-binding protein [Pseudomonadota bacterium]
MSRQKRYDILFEEVKIGPVCARNRFFQVPHCNGMGYRDPKALAAMRAVKAEGGWAVVCSEETEIDTSSDVCPHIEMRLWDESDIKSAAHIADQIHKHGALAGMELAHNGRYASNHYTREVPIAPSCLPVGGSNCDPLHACAMDKADIKAFRQSHQSAVKRALSAGYDLIYVYAGHGLTLIEDFISRERNHRHDEYGGSLKNRARLLREVIEDSLNIAVGKAAIAVRITIDEFKGNKGLHQSEMEELIDDMADLPDLWDLVMARWEEDSPSSRFSDENANEAFFANIKNITSKPLVGTGRFSDVDLMVRLVKQKKLDFIGCARPSIADPFLPAKIEQGRFDDIRECIGCNICVSGDFLKMPIRCTQNPTISEEWRRGWHPEKTRPALKKNETVLIIGSGPAGLEAAMVLGKRGFEVICAEQHSNFGGRVLNESQLPGLHRWKAVCDYRLTQLNKLSNVALYHSSMMDVDDILEFKPTHIAVATGCRWRRDGVGYSSSTPMMIKDGVDILTPDDLINAKRPNSRHVTIWDDDHYYMASCLAELLVGEGYMVDYITSQSKVASWSFNTMEQHRIQKRLIDIGVQIKTDRLLQSIDQDHLVTSCAYTDQIEQIACKHLIMVGARIGDHQLSLKLQKAADQWMDHKICSSEVIGDAKNPATIAHATFSGRLYAEEIDLEREPSRPVYLSKKAFKRDI